MSDLDPIPQFRATAKLGDFLQKIVSKLPTGPDNE